MAFALKNINPLFLSLAISLLVNLSFSKSASGQIINNALISQFQEAFSISTKDSIRFEELKGKDLSKVISQVNKSVKKDESFSSGRLFLAFLFYQTEDYQNSLKELDKLIAQDDDCADAYFLRGNVYLEMELYQKALNDYKQTLKKDNEYTNALNNIAVIRIRNQGTGGLHSNDLKLAKSDILEIFKSDSTSNSRILMNIGLIHIGLFEHSDAHNYFSKVIELEDQLQAEAYFNRGLSSYYQRNYSSAKVDFIQAYDMEYQPERSSEFIEHITYIQSQSIKQF